MRLLRLGRDFDFGRAVFRKGEQKWGKSMEIYGEIRLFYGRFFLVFFGETRHLKIIWGGHFGCFFEGYFFRLAKTMVLEYQHLQNWVIFGANVGNYINIPAPWFAYEIRYR